MVTHIRFVITSPNKYLSNVQQIAHEGSQWVSFHKAGDMPKGYLEYFDNLGSTPSFHNISFKQEKVILAIKQKNDEIVNVFMGNMFP